MRILICEDDQISNELLKMLLEREGHDVVSTEDGMQAYKEYNKPNSPKLLLLDWMLPGMNGVELTKKIRAIDTLYPPYIIIVTCRDQREDKITGLNAGADDYIVKPYNSDVLKTRINAGIRIIEMQNKLQNQVTEIERYATDQKILLDNIQTQIWYLSDQNTYGAVNKAHADFLGYRQEEIAFAKMKDLLSEEKYRDFIDRNKSVFLSRKIEKTEESVMNKNGKKRIMSIVRSPVFNQINEIEYVVCSAEDITETKKAEKSLQKSEKRFRSYMENAPLGIFVYDENGDYLDANPKACELTGCSKNELLKKNLYSFSSYKNHDELDKFFLKLKLEGFAQAATTFIKKTGEMCYWAIDAAKISSNKYLMFSEDITNQKIAERKLRFAEKSIEDAVYLVFWVLSDGSITHANKTACKVLGRSYDDIIKLSIDEIDSGYPINRRCDFWAGLKKNKSMKIQSVYKKADNTSFPVEVSSFYLEFENEEYEVVMTQDITEIRKAEAEKIKLEKQILHAQKMESIGTMAGGIAHDFNNILTPILGYSDMALTNLEEGNKLHSDINEIQKAAKRAKSLVAQMLNFGRQCDQIRKPMYLQKVVKEVANLMRSSIPVTVNINLNIDDNCKRILADSDKMHQMLVNLCTNANHAMKGRGELTIGLEMIHLSEDETGTYLELSPGDYVLLSVKDTGEGMTEETRYKIFDPFFTTKDVGEGSGLGLSVVMGIVNNHEAQITVYSELGNGSVFKIYFPLYLKNYDDTKISKETKLVKGDHERILIVDDKVSITKMLGKMLKQIGYEVILMNNSLEALAFMHNQHKMIDLVITDLTMPGMTGIELSEAIHEMDSKLPILLMTGYGNRVSKENIYRADIIKVLEKPILTNELSLIIKNVLIGRREK